MNIVKELESFLFSKTLTNVKNNVSAHTAINDAVLVLANVIDKFVLHDECKNLAIMTLREVQEYARVGANLNAFPNTPITSINPDTITNGTVSNNIAPDTNI